MSTIVVRIFKHDPKVGGNSKYRSYKMSLQGKRWSVLGVVKKIWETQDPTLSFTYSCRLGKCTRCAMRVNGKVVLACVEPVTCDLTIEPVSTTSVAKDLVTSAKDFKARTIQRAPVDIRRRLR